MKNGNKMKKNKKQSNGLYLEWYSNGVKASSTNYKDGKENGLSEAWYSNEVKKKLKSCLN